MVLGSFADTHGPSLFWTTRATHVAKTTQLTTACCCLLRVGHRWEGGGGVAGQPTAQVEEVSARGSLSCVAH
eukprot:5018371-Pyramimonas_sp.AAC.1